MRREDEGRVRGELSTHFEGETEINGVIKSAVQQNSELKAAEDSRTPGRSRAFAGGTHFRQVLECGCPLPLWIEAAVE